MNDYATTQTGSLFIEQLDCKNPIKINSNSLKENGIPNIFIVENLIDASYHIGGEYSVWFNQKLWEVIPNQMLRDFFKHL